MNYSTKPFQHLINPLQIADQYVKMINAGNKNYKVQIYNIKKITPQEILQMYHSIARKNYGSIDNYTEDSWYQNELKVFIWILLTYSFKNQIKIEDFKQQDWQKFVPTFNNRSLEFFEFQAKAIIKAGKKASKWTQEETILLNQIITYRGIDNKWNLIARQLFTNSNKRYFKTPKQCRERWLNHLDPAKKHQKWSIQQDQKLFRYVESTGKKWAAISKSFNQTRTEHMIKNRYKAVINLYQKKHKKLKQDQLVKKILSNIENGQFQVQSSNRRGSRLDVEQVISQVEGVQLLDIDGAICQANYSMTGQSQDQALQNQKDPNFEHKQTEIQKGSQRFPYSIAQILKHVDVFRIEVEGQDNLPFFEDLNTLEDGVIPFIQNQHQQSFISQCMKTPLFSAFMDEESMEFLKIQ